MNSCHNWTFVIVIVIEDVEFRQGILYAVLIIYSTATGSLHYVHVANVSGDEEGP